ncbi:MAG: SPOR domain-containing protein [Bacteroidota bacterium]
MQVEKYIEELLYRYNCVVLPGFGAFLAHSKSAYVNTGNSTIHPPSKTISFNGQLSKNDGLLVSYMAEAHHLSYEEMLDEIERISTDWKNKLKNGQQIELIGIGKLLMNGNQKTHFEPENKVNYLTSSFGLSSFVATQVKREILKEEVTALEDQIPFIITPEKREKVAFRPWLKYAAIILLALSTGFTGFRFYNNTIVNNEMVRQNAQRQVSKYIQEATFFDSAPIELPAFNLDINKVENDIHHVIAGAFRFKKNADKQVLLLRKKGYEALYLGPNTSGLHQVAYASFENPDEALAFLKEIRRAESRDAWLLSER